MTTKRIVYTRPDGGLSIVNPCEGARLARAVTLGDEVMRADARPVDTFLRRWPVEGAIVEWAESEDEFVARIAAKDVPGDATDIQVLDVTAIPSDRTFRDAWKAGDGCVEHDMDKAREINKRRLRAIADEQKRIAAEKQSDVTYPAIAAAETIEELKAISSE